MNVQIRPCVPGDAGALALVSQATYLETYAGVVPGADMVRYCAEHNGEALYEAWLARPDVYLWLAEAPLGAPVGYAALMSANLPVDPRPGDMELKRIYLLRRFHGQGLGALLVQAVTRRSVALGCRRLLLSVLAANEGALAFYARQGFARLGAHKFRVGLIDYDDLILGRDLQA